MFSGLAYTGFVALFASVVLGLVSSAVRQEIGWEERLLFCVEWHVKPQLNQSVGDCLL